MRGAALVLCLALAAPAVGQDALGEEVAVGADVGEEVPAGRSPGGAAERRAPGVVTALSQTAVSITSTFSGSEILVFGAITDAPSDEALGVVVTIEGPRQAVTVRRKGRVAGVWANTASSVVEAPSFHAVATSGPLAEVLAPEEDRRLSVTAPRSVAAPPGAQGFRGALLRIRRASGDYAVLEGEVTVQRGTLFRAEIALPSDLVEGPHRARVLLTRGGLVIAEEVTGLAVRKVGLERLLYQGATERPALYGAASLVIAVAAGWGAQALFGLLRR